VEARLEISSNNMTRDMLASTASFINCVGGVNGGFRRCKIFSDRLEVLTA
jgi:hypothetical protein